MRAMVLEAPGQALRETDRSLPAPGPTEVLVRVRACGVCRTDLHVLDGELPRPKLPLILGHEVVGTVERTGDAVDQLRPRDRIGLPWLGWACGRCRFCRRGAENLCPLAEFTGYQRDGGYAEQLVADARFVFPLPANIADEAAAPLLCAGLIGYRTLRLAGDAERVGLYGFGAAAHLVAQVARHQGRRVFAFTRPGDAAAQAFARELGATWAGDSTAAPPEPLDAALLFAPIGDLVPLALRAVEPGGVVVCGGIHMSDIPSFPYDLLWHERVLRSVANLTRQDGRDFLALAATMPLRTETHPYALARANDALDDLRHGRFTGAAVLSPLSGIPRPGRPVDPVSGPRYAPIETQRRKEPAMAIRIGDIAPDFEQDSTEGRIKFHDWIGNQWAVLFSHPKDFTPVCTTELGRAANLKGDFAKRSCKMIAVSVDDVASHKGWIGDINETQNATMNFPILGDPDRKVSGLYDMIHPNANDTLTVRSVFFIDPSKKVRAMITYPASTGRNFAEILRVLDSLQLTDHHQVATPADWKEGDDCVIVPSLTDPDELKRKFPKGWKALKPYLRMTPQPNR
jgi:propanol-preferring alcohol dehydrogenase